MGPIGRRRCGTDIGALLVGVVVLADRDPQVADAARLYLFGQGRPRLRIVEGLPRAGVELVQVDVVGSKRLERGVELSQDLVRSHLTLVRERSRRRQAARLGVTLEREPSSMLPLVTTEMR